MRVLVLMLLATATQAQTLRFKLEFERADYPTPSKEFRQPVGSAARVAAFDPKNHLWNYAVAIGSPVLAARDGVVIGLSQASNIGGPEERFLEHGNYVSIDHLDGTVSVYYSLQRDSLRVRLLEWVLQGECIARSGDTGCARGPRLTYGVVDRKTQVGVASRFADFEQRNGIPIRGDFVGAGVFPVLGQDRIDLYKRAIRQARSASRAKCWGIAWRAVRDPRSLPRDKGYHYERLRHELEANTREKLVQELRAAAHAPAGELRALRLRHALKGTDGARIQGLLQDLPGGANPDRAAENWIKGLEARFDGRPADARVEFLKARGGTGSLRGQMDKELRLELEFWRASVSAKVERTIDEAKIVSKNQSDRMIEDLHAHMKDAEALEEFHLQAFPSEADAAKKYRHTVAVACDAAVRMMEVSGAR